MYPAVGQDYDLIQEGNILLLFRDPVSVNVTLRRDNVAGEPTETIILTLMHNINFPPVENEIQLYSTVIINVQDQDGTYICVCTFMYICVQ